MYDDIRARIDDAVRGLSDAKAEEIVEEFTNNSYPGMTEKEVGEALVLSARSLVEVDPDYSYVAARLLIQKAHQEVRETIGTDPYGPNGLSLSLQTGVLDNRINPRLFERFDIPALERAMVPERDRQFQLLGAQTVYDRYLLHVDGNRYEMPQTFFMRVAMGLAIEEDDPTARAIEFYELLSTFRFMSSTPTLFNSGTQRPQMSSCFLTTIDDDIDSITKAVGDNAKLSKFAGGLGNDWTPIRGTGAKIHGTNGESSGVIPFMKVMESNTIAWNQGGKRKGAVCAYLETWHLDIEDFLDLRRNTGDDRRRTHEMNTANWIPDLFMERVEADEEWTLFSPDEVPGLHDLYGNAFRVAYETYELAADMGQIKNFRRVSAKDLWRKMLTRLFETGHPWITFKDPSNLRSPQQHEGVVHSSNLCTEITLNTSADEVAVCNLGSVNLVAHVNDNGTLDANKLRETVAVAVRMLDNVIDINYYTIPEARNSNLRHRPVGLGLMGFHDALYKKGVAYDSAEAADFADESMEFISYYAIQASAELARERGAYESFSGSEWSEGRVPYDTLMNSTKHRKLGDYDINRDSRFEWEALRAQVRRGMRNSNVLAIAPTATIANICGVSQGIDPSYQNLYVKSSMSGDFTIVNPYLVADLKEFGLWNEEVRNALKEADGSLQGFSDISVYLRDVYKTAFEIDPHRLVDAAARRQKWIDQSQSLNLFMEEPSGKRLDALYRHAWRSGLKSTYYLRSRGATTVEKTTLQQRKSSSVVNPGVSLIDQIEGDTCQSCQ